MSDVARTVSADELGQGLKTLGERLFVNRQWQMEKPKSLRHHMAFVYLGGNKLIAKLCYALDFSNRAACAVYGSFRSFRHRYW